MDLSQTDRTIQQFEAYVRELLKKGASVEDAVRIAYERYPIMETMRDEVEAQIRVEMQRGFGAPLPETIMAAAMAKPWSPDGLTLSARTTRGRAEVVINVINALKDAVKNGDAMRDTAKTLYDGYGMGKTIPQQELAKYVGRLMSLWRQNNGAVDGETYEALMRQIRAVKRNYDRLTDDRNSMNHYRTALKELLDAVEEGKDKAVYGALRVAAEEKSRYAAERIARTELARAYADGFMAKWGPDEDCVAFRWKLSTRHPHADICDLYANADLYGLGKGVFPKWKVPMLPVHPHCMCHLVPLMDGQVDMAKLRERVEKGGREYIDKMKPVDRMALLGRVGIKGVAEGGEWTKYARSFNWEFMNSRLAHDSDSDIIKSIREFILSNVQSKKIDRGNQDKHIPGTNNFKQKQKDYQMHGKYGPSYITLSDDEIEALIGEFCGTGVILVRKGKWTNQEIILTNEKIVGIVVNDLTGKSVPTTVFKIHYGKRGVHIVPDYPSKKRK